MNNASFRGMLSLFLCAQELRQRWQGATQQQSGEVWLSLLSCEQEKECPFFMQQQRKMKMKSKAHEEIVAIMSFSITSNL
jgi:hypothetical protein